MALRTKSFRLVLNGVGLWSQIIKHKYLKNLLADVWLRHHTFKVQGTSHMWNGFIRAMSWITRCLGWKNGNGKNIKLGIDPIARFSSDYTLLEDLRLHLEDYGILTLSDALNRGIATSSTDYWISADELELGGVGFQLMLSQEHYYCFKIGVGLSTNTKSELLALWTLVHCSKNMGLPSLHIHGDFAVIINWFNQISALTLLTLNGWCHCIRELEPYFIQLTAIHI